MHIKREINGVHITSYNFTFRLLFEIIFKQNLASYINKPYSFDIINRGMLSKLKMILKNFNNTPIVHSENDAILLYNILDNIYKNLSWEDVYLLEYVFSKEPKVFSWKTTDNNSKYPNMFVVECPIIGEKDKAIKNIKEQGKNIAKYCRKLLKDSEITSDIYKFLVFDRSIYTRDGRLMMYYCYKGDGKEAEVE